MQFGQVCAAGAGQGAAQSAGQGAAQGAVVCVLKLWR